MATDRERRRKTLLRELGRRVRERREDLGLSQRALAASAGLSARFLAELESGLGNISVARLADVAQAMGSSAGALLAGAEGGPVVAPAAAPPPVAAARPLVSLLGLRGAGKTTVGERLAARLGVPFFELDQLVEMSAGLPLGPIFELHGERYFRRLERETLARFLVEQKGHGAVLATGGGIVTEAATYELLRRHTVTVWLRARAREHWDRVVAQGDRRPMANRAEAMAELQALLEARTPLYARAEVVVDTSAKSVAAAVARVAAELESRLLASR